MCSWYNHLNQEETGQVEAPTWKALFVKSKKGDTGDHVKAIQALLFNLYEFNDLSDVSGEFEAATEAAVIDFQECTLLVSHNNLD